MAADKNNKYDIRELAEKWVNGTITEAEKAYFEEWYAGFKDEAITLSSSRHPDAEALRQSMLSDIYRKISQQNKEAKADNRRLIYRIAAAASVVVCLLAGGYFLLHKLSKQPTVQNSPRDIAPGGNKAVLTLANGTTIILDNAHNGQLASQGNSRIIKSGNGLLTYNMAGAGQGKQSQVVYNTLATPRGGQYKLVLPDGTKIWLNAASSIRYPTAFTGKERIVTITGEAYFEVAEDARKPFRVFANNMAVQVLGTHFNVMAYEDETITKVTLLEGAVNIVKDDQHILLKAGEQAQLGPNGNLSKAGNINTQGAISWVNNQFWFNNADIYTVMRQISRWYNVDVIIKGNIPQHFAGYIPRDVSVSKIFEVLQQTNLVHFSIDHKTIIVSP